MTNPGGAEPGACSARGRPAVSDNREVSNELLHAMEHGLRNKSHLDLTTREIALAAGTNAGMIHYYYHGKNGLIDAALDNLSCDIAQTLNDLNTLFMTDCQDATRKIVGAWMYLLEKHKGTASVRARHGRLFGGRIAAGELPAVPSVRRLVHVDPYAPATRGVRDA